MKNKQSSQPGWIFDHEVSEAKYICLSGHGFEILSLISIQVSNAWNIGYDFIAYLKNLGSNSTKPFLVLLFSKNPQKSSAGEPKHVGLAEPKLMQDNQH